MTDRKRIRRLVLPVAGLAWVLSGAAYGAVVGANGVVTTRVQEQQNGEPGSVTSDQESLGEAGAEFPLNASAALDSTDLEGAIVSLAEGLSRLDDPTRLDDPNPREFGLESCCYSDAESISYVITSDAEETRTVLFTTAGNPAAPPEIEFGPGLTADVESRVFLSGAMLLWSKDPDTPTDDLVAALTVGISRGDTGDVLFSANTTVFGSGSTIGDPETTGPIVVERVNLADLAELGLDDASLNVLKSVADSGSLAVFVIPQQSHAYEYTVTANEPLDLMARLEATVKNVPAGTGVAATWGRPFTNVVDFVERGLPGVDGPALQQALNKAMETGLPSGTPDETGQVRDPFALPCGAFGFGGLALFAGAWPILRLGRSTLRRF
jgi:hypothetical protein